MRLRLISAAVLVPVVILVFLAGQPWLTLAIALLASLAGYETAKLTAHAGLPANIWLSVAVPPAVVLAVAIYAVPVGTFALPTNNWVFIAPAVALWFVAVAVAALRQPDAEAGFRTWVGTAFATLYPSLLAFLAAIALVTWPVFIADDHVSVFDRGRIWLLALVLTIWSLDSAAYLIGRAIPRGRFMNHISPNKTWSGAIGGTLAAVVVCALVLWVTRAGDVLWGAIIGLLIAVAAQAGDLAESMLKRAAGAKDSGRLIPGHGGVLDRVDSFLFAAPVVYVAMLVMLFYADTVR